MDLRELFIKYSIVDSGLKRFYFFKLNERRFDIENCVPAFININKEMMVIDNAWNISIHKIATYLQKTFPKDHQELYGLRVDWTNTPMFYETNERTNIKKVEEGLYVNANHTAVHSLWFIEELLKIYGIDIDSAYIILSRTPNSEPKEIRDAVAPLIMGRFRKFLKENLKYDDINANNISNSFNKFNQIVQKTNRTSVNNIFLIDEVGRLEAYRKILFEACLSIYNSKKIEIIKKYVNIYDRFLRWIVNMDGIYYYGEPLDKSDLKNLK